MKKLPSGREFAELDGVNIGSVTVNLITNIHLN
jgi:hypothetical protein